MGKIKSNGDINLKVGMERQRREAEEKKKMEEARRRWQWMETARGRVLSDEEIKKLEELRRLGADIDFF